MNSDEPIRISWSKIRTAEECQHRSWLYNSGKKAGSRDSRLYIRGTVVDRVMRNWLADPVPGAMPGMVRSTLDYEEGFSVENGDGVVRWKTKDDREQSIDWCVRLVEELEPILNEVALPFNYFSSQSDLKFSLPVKIPIDDVPTTVILNGEMDLLVHDSRNRHYYCWDLKGTENDQYWKKVVGQLVFYDIATAIKYGQFCERTGLIQPLANPKFMVFKFEKQDYQVMWQRIIRYAEATKKGLKEFTEDRSVCNYCDFKHSCELYAPIKTADGRRKVPIRPGGSSGGSRGNQDRDRQGAEGRSQG